MSKPSAARDGGEHSPGHCTVCGDLLSGQYKLDICRRTPECLRLSTSRHNFLHARRRKAYTPCAGCGGDWLRGGRSEKLCGECRQEMFWCSGRDGRAGHVAPLSVKVGTSTCRACRMLRHAAARAAAKQIPFDLSWEDVESAWSDTCPYLGIPLTHGTVKLTRSSPSLDRIIPALGYVAGNVEVISHRANTMKGEATPDELVTFAQVLLQRYAPGARAVAS